MPTEIDSRYLLAAAMDRHTSGTFLVVGYTAAPCGESSAPGLEVVRSAFGHPDEISGDVKRCLAVVQAALTYPVGGVLTILQAGDTWKAWCWQLLAGSAVPMSAHQTDYFVRCVLKFKNPDEGETLHIQSYAGYPIKISAE